MKAGHRALFVLGMHRSGTSAVTGVLARLGVQLGRRLVAPQAGVNERGFWEHADIVDVHDRALWSTASSWDDILFTAPPDWTAEARAPFAGQLAQIVRRDFAAAPLWGLKDPRTCRLLPLWDDVAAACGFARHHLLVVRHPQEVAGSLARRDGFHPDKSLLLWAGYSLLAERGSRGQPRCVVLFDDLMRDPRAVLEAVEAALALRFPVTVDAAMPAVSDFLSSELRHHARRPAPPADGWARLAEDVFDALAGASVLASAAAGDALADRGETFDALRRELETRLAALDPMLVEHIRGLAARAGAYHREYNAVYHSLSWRLSWPLRRLERLVRSR